MEMCSIPLRIEIDMGKHSRQGDPLNIYVSACSLVWLDVVCQSFWGIPEAREPHVTSPDVVKVAAFMAPDAVTVAAFIVPRVVKPVAYAAPFTYNLYVFP